MSVHYSIISLGGACVVNALAMLCRLFTYYLLILHNLLYIFFRGLSTGNEAAFREAYGQLGQLRAFIRNAPFVCLSATATSEVIRNVSSSLCLDAPAIIRVEINKRNIR